MTDEEHRQLARTLRQVKGKVAVSGYRCDLMDEIYRGFRRVEAPAKMCHSIKKERREALWMNY
jgi:DNA adenine methylase